MFNTVQINFDHIVSNFNHLFSGAEFVKMHGNGELIRKYHYVVARGQCRLTFFQMPTGSWIADLEVREDFPSPCNACNYILQAPLGSSDPVLYNGFWNMSRNIKEDEMLNILERFEQLAKN